MASSNTCNDVIISSVEVSLKELPDALDEIDMTLASQKAARNFLTHYKCESWKAVIPFHVFLPQSSTFPEELTFIEHHNILVSQNY
jgi:hypothetical protein